MKPCHPRNFSSFIISHFPAVTGVIYPIRSSSLFHYVNASTGAQAQSAFLFLFLAEMADGRRFMQNLNPVRVVTKLRAEVFCAPARVQIKEPLIRSTRLWQDLTAILANGCDAAALINFWSFLPHYPLAFYFTRWCVVVS